MSSRKSLKNLTLDEWADKFWDLYKDVDSKRGLQEIWLAAVNTTSCAAEGIRNSEFLEVNKGLARTFSWLCAFYKRCSILPEESSLYIGKKFWEVIGFKYPSVCGRCVNNQCLCGLNRTVIDFQKTHDLYYGRLEKLRGTFDGANHTLQKWSRMFTLIFGNTIYSATIESLGFHLMEETGEVARAIRWLVENDRQVKVVNNKDGDMLIEEIADVFSFLNAVAVKASLLYTGIQTVELNNVRSNKPIPIEERLNLAEEYFVDAVINEYKNPEDPKEILCRDCKKNPCGCYNWQ